MEEQQPSESDPAAALVRITTPDSVVERWITLGVNNPLNPPDCYRKNDYITLECKDSAGKAKWLVVSIPREKVELNFQILLERFNRRLDPGTSMPSHYSSDITVVDNSIVSNKTDHKFEHVRVQLNQPVNFVNPKNGQSYRIYQSSFSGPIDTSSPIYRWVVGNQIQPTDASAPLYSSTFTVNYDPGRGMLYLGCLLICFGIGFHYYLRGAKPMKNPMKLPDEKPKNANVSVLSSVVLIISMMLCSPSFADSKTDCVNLSLESLPVLESGRVQPLNTVAINAVKSICGSSTPTLSLDGAAISGELNTHSAGQITRLFAQSCSRSFTALELFYRWQIEPEVWEHIPFIECSNPDLRRLLGVNLLDSRGQALKYVSPVQIVRSSALPDYRYNLVQQQQQEQRAGITHQSTKLEKSVLKLLDAFEKYRAITFYPQAAENPRDACAELVSRILQTQMTLLPSEIQSECAKNNDSKISTLPQKISQYGQSFQNIFISYSQSQEYKQTDRSLDSIVNQINLYDDAIDIYIQFVQNRIKYNKDKSKQLIYTDSLRALESIEKDLILLRFRLYDEGGLPGVVPSLNPMAVDLWRNPDDHTAVWLSIPTLLYGDTVVLAGFPQDKIAQFRLLYSQAAESILNDDYPAAIKAQQKLTENIKSLAAFADSKRLTLLPENRLDKQVLSASAYPVSKKACQLIQWELFYYQLKPFQWALIFSAMATILFVIGSIIPNWGERKIRIVLQWGAGALMLAGVGFIGYGLLLRGYIMSRSPVANMFETIMFVAFMTGLLGLFLPLFPPGTSVIGKAWQQTAFTTGSRKPIYWIVQIIRWIIAAVLFYALVFVSYGAGQGYSAVSLTPRLAMGASIPGLSDVLVWLASILLLIIVIFWIPRVVCTVLYLCTDYISKDKMKSDSSEMESRSFTQFDTLIAQACGAGLMCLLTGAAINAPMFNDDLKNLMPILRDNFWLAIHVISIVGGYGTAMLAWILGNAALTAFAVGQYRLQKSADNPDKITPPEITRTLSSLMYSCIKATIWLLAIGIILGGLWADVSWGRFWSWDRKEVWALISMVVYLIFVHALHWGWFKNNRELTMTLASVSGALAILMAWYGVNYLLGSTMHGYASGSGGLAPAIAFVGANIAFVALAMVRYVSEMRRFNSNQQQ